NAIVWRGPMASSALKQFITEVEWGDLDYLLLDLPPGTSDIHLTMVQTIPVTGAIIVTTPQPVALMDAQKGLQMFRQPQINVPVLGIIENMAWFTPAELPENKYYIFGEGGGQRLADKHQVPLIGQLPLIQAVREAGDQGRPANLPFGVIDVPDWGPRLAVAIGGYALDLYACAQLGYFDSVAEDVPELGAALPK
nr:iron-sulfur protein NUBPL [Tanacetum cinerariifolium]